ncbi:MAG: GGDEF domain-containing protein [Acidiferrobacterales bacterium]
MFHRRAHSIRNRFLISLGAMLLPLVILGTTTYVSIDRVVGAFTHVVDDPYTELRLVARTQVAVSKALMPPNDYLVHGNKNEILTFALRSKEADRLFDLLEKDMNRSERERALIRSAGDEWAKGKVQALELLAISRPVGNRQAAIAMEQMDKQFDKILAKLDAANQIFVEEAESELHSARMVHDDVILKVWLVMLLGLAIAVVAGWSLLQSTVIPIQKLHRVVQQFGRGQLDQRVEIKNNDEVGKLASAFNDMANQVQSITETLTNESTHDPLTGVLNRREFERQFQNMLQHAIRHNRPLAVAMIDLDHFKQINDSHGHQLGDEYLKVLCKVIESNLRPGDVFARYGGEEFVAVLPESDSVGARRVAERLRLLAAGAGIKRNGQLVSTTISIGLSTFPADGATIAELMAASDRALYGAKAAGRDRVETAQEI